MDEHSLRVLEFDKVLSLLVKEAETPMGAELIQALRPANDLAVVRARQAETSCAARLLERAGPVSFTGVRDIRPLLPRARAGGMLNGEELAAVASTLSAAGRLQAFLRHHLTDEPRDQALRRLQEALRPLPPLVSAIQRCLTPEGDILDTASPELARLRGLARTLQQRVRDRLESLIHSPLAQKVLQEPIVTLRAGRYVVPVKHEHRAAVPGLVHDQSASGATLFVEPLAVVELNNQLREVEARIQEEVERILRQLSQQVGAAADELAATLEALAQLDLALAKGRFSHTLHGTEPILNQEGWFHIRRGRHPLLGTSAVPIDLWLGRDFRILLLTGPNTGGKTVTLKTVGLFCLMAQSGLHLPAADGTELPLVQGVYADIGDEQSIEQSLSTFSSHMSRIVAILRQVGPQDLVLLDELGAGTDPEEGAALAMAILAHLREVGCRVVATTHYSELKTFAHLEPAIENASVEFDPETLRPTYRLAIGIPGRSHAFLIAARLGLPESILARARQHMSQEELRTDALIADMERDRRRAAEDREEAARLREALAEQVRRYEELTARIRAERESLLASARSEARRLLRAARRQADDLLGQLRSWQRAWETARPQAGGEGALPAGPSLEDVARTVRTGLSEALARVEDSSESPAWGKPAAPVPGLAPRPPRPGGPVKVRSLGQQGMLLETRGDEGLVQLGPLRLTVPLTDLEGLPEPVVARVSGRPEDGRREGPAPRAERPAGVGTLARAKGQNIATSLDLRGLTAAEALERLDKYLDDALLAGLERITIIHGKGTGALRAAVQEALRSHPRVAEFRLGGPGEGGDGVTVATLH